MPTKRRVLIPARAPVMMILALIGLAGPLANQAESQGKGPDPATRAKIRLATPAPSLSYLPIHIAIRKGFFARRGFDMEIIQMAAGLAAPALLNRSIDYTTIPSGRATGAAQGAPLKVICFTSVKLQHLLISRPEIAAVSDLAGKRIGAGGLGTLPAYEARFIIDRYRLGPNTAIISVPSSMDRLIGTQKGSIDAGIVSAPLDLKAEEMGLKRLLHIGSILQIPQAGLATTEEKLRSARAEVIEVLKAINEGLDYTWTQREGTIEIIARWMNLSPAQAATTYDSVRDTFSKNGIPTDEQAKAYVAMLGATAGLKGDPSPAVIFDFSFAAEAARR